MTIVDTTVWVDYLRGIANPHTEWLDRQLGQQALGLTDITLCEVLQGIQGNSKFDHTLGLIQCATTYSPCAPERSASPRGK